MIWAEGRFTTSGVGLKDWRFAERLAHGLTIFTFFMLCWVCHRALQLRVHCLNSKFIAAVKMDGRRLDNCLFESRLNLDPLFYPINLEQNRILRSLESIDSLSSILPSKMPTLIVEVAAEDPLAFELKRGGKVVLGKKWLTDTIQLRRALIMAVVHDSPGWLVHNRFQLEVVADFLLLSIFREDLWPSSSGQLFLSEHLKFPTVAADFATYCRSPLVSLAHLYDCRRDPPDSKDLEVKIWGARSLLALALRKVYLRLSLREKLAVAQKLHTGIRLPLISVPVTDQAKSMAVWFRKTLEEHLFSLGMIATNSGRLAFRQVLKDLQVETPLSWELTVDLTSTPAWREIVEQLRTRSRFVQAERVLIFTPEGQLALPSGLPVAWSPGDVRSQKHVLVACEWPGPSSGINVKARHLYAAHSCGKLTNAFW